MAEYMLQWLNDNLLLRTEVDLPVFSQIVEACMLIQRFSREKKNIKNPEIVLAIWLNHISLWDSAF